MNDSSPAARVRQGRAHALLTVATLALFTALLALAPTTPDAAAAAADDCDSFTLASFADGDCHVSGPCDDVVAAAATDCCDVYEIYNEAVASDCGDEVVLETPDEETPVEAPADEVPPAVVPTAAPATVPARPLVPPPPPITGPITTGPITGNLSAELSGQQLTITVPADLSVQLQPAVYINAGGAFHAGPLPADGQVTLTVRPGTGPITIALQGIVWTGAWYSESLVVPR